MPYVFWIGLTICRLRAFWSALIAGARSRTTRRSPALAIGAYIGLMAGFPLLALGLASS